MRLWKTLPSKDEFAAKFEHFPILEHIVLVLLYDWRFRLAVLGLVTVAIGGIVALLPVWRSTPPGFTPVHRVKLIDLWQARVLRRTALAEIAKGQTRAGLMTMRTAVSNNPGDLALVREFVTLLKDYGDPKHHTTMALQNSFWLLQLSNTNTVELELVAGLFDRFLLDDLLVQLLKPMEEQLSPALEKAYVKALFMARDVSSFATHWAKLQTQGVGVNDPRLRLVRAAYLAGWTDGASARDGQEALNAAKNDAALSLLANRLQLIVSERKHDVESYGEALENLVNAQATNLADHMAYWRLLAASGQTEKAIELARSNVYVPRTGDEAIMLARTLYEFGLPDEARQVLYKYARHFVVADHLWLSLGNLLIVREDWNELGKIALEMRDEANPSRSGLLCLSYFYEGLSELKQYRIQMAEEAFRRAARTHCENETVLLRVAGGMTDVGYYQPAQELLLKNQQLAEKDPVYWELLGKVSYHMRDFPTLVHAAIKTHNLKPNDVTALQNHAAALLSMRSMPEEAIALTLELYRRQPTSPGAILNHAAALVQNRRFAEARTLLQSLDESKLGEESRSTYYLVLMEIFLEQGDYANAATAAEKVDRKFMFPPEMEWYENALKQIKGNSRPASSSSHANSRSGA